MTQIGKSQVDLTVVILTYNEEIHLRRVIESVRPIAKEVIVVDSFSTDQTITIANEMGVRVLQNRFINQALQFQWALDHCNIQTAWTMRMDADEYLTTKLQREITQRLPVLEESITGVELKRQVHFMGQWIRYGGYYPIKLLRIWRTGLAAIEQRQMDEHTYLLKGNAITFEYDFVDDNQNNLTWWTNKHNSYATREAIDILLNARKVHKKKNPVEHIERSSQAGIKRWYKQNFYLRLPLFIRAFLYFQYRYWIRLGILDGRKGLVWHFLQGFWYRFLVDAKILQIRYLAKMENRSVQEIIEQHYHSKNE